MSRFFRYATELQWTFVAVAAQLCMTTAPGGAADAEVVTYRGDARAVLKKHCVACHNTARPSAGLDVSSYDGILRGSDSGEVVISGDASDSYLFLVTSHDEEPAMPPEGNRIPDSDLAILEKWINDGLVRDTDSHPPGQPLPGAPNPPKATKGSSNESGNEYPTGPVFIGHRSSPIVAVAASEASQLIAVGGQMQVLLFGMDDNRLIGVLPFPEGEPQELTFASDGRILAAAGGVNGQSGRLVLWNAANGKRLWTGGNELDAIQALDVSPNGRYVVYGGTDRRAKMIDIESGVELHNLEKHTNWVLSTAFGPQGLIFATGDRDGNVYIWETVSGNAIYSLRGHQAAVVQIGWQDGGNVCVTASEDGTVRRWDMHNGQQMNQWRAHPNGVIAMSSLQDGRLLTAGRDSTCRCWTNDGDASDLVLTTDTLPLTLAGYGPHTAIIGHYDGAIRTWHVENGQATALEIPETLATDDESVLSVVSIDSMANRGDSEPASSSAATESTTADSRMGTGELLAQITAVESRVNDASQRLPSLIARIDDLRTRAEDLNGSKSEAATSKIARQLQSLKGQLRAKSDQLELLDGRRERLGDALDNLQSATAAIGDDGIADGSQTQARQLTIVATEKIEQAIASLERQRSELATAIASIQENLDEAHSAHQRATRDSTSGKTRSLSAELRQLEEEIARLAKPCD